MTLLVDLAIAAARDPWVAIPCVLGMVVIVGSVVGLVAVCLSRGPRA